MILIPRNNYHLHINVFYHVMALLTGNSFTTKRCINNVLCKIINLEVILNIQPREIVILALEIKQSLTEKVLFTI